MPEPQILLFSCKPVDLGWQETFPGDLQNQMALLLDCINIDIAERLSTEYAWRVVLHDTGECPVKEMPTAIRKQTQAPGPLRTRVLQAVKEQYQANENAEVVVFLGRNPLYRFEYVDQGIRLLAQEDNVLVLGETQQGRRSDAIIWYATKAFHPPLYNHPGSGGNVAALQSAVDTNALVMPLRSGRDLAGSEDIKYLFHEIEREVLLKHWFPPRTYEMLKYITTEA